MPSALALFLAAAAAAAPAGAAYPEDAVLAAFKDACAVLDSAAAADAAIRTQGWEPFTPDPETPFGKLVGFGKAIVAEDYEGGEYRRTVEGRPLELALSAVDNDEDGVAIGCRVYDMAATAPLSDPAIRRFGGDGFRTTHVPGEMEGVLWEPGVVAQGHSKTQIAYVPAGSRMAASVHLVGIALMTQKVNPPKGATP